MISAESLKASTKPHRARLAQFGAAVGLANLGDGIAVVAWTWTASLLTRDPLWIAVLPAALRLPWVLFSLPSGILADRVDRRRLIVFGDLSRALAYIIAGGVILINLPLSDPPAHGVDNVHLYVCLLTLGFVVGCAEVARDNAAQSMVPSLVRNQDLEHANGILGSVETVGNQMAGPALGAFLISLFLPLPFLIIALAFLGAALLTASLSGSFKAPPSGGVNTGWQEELMEGVRFVLRHQTLRFLVLVTGFWNFFAEMALMGMILHVQENLQSGATTYGLILALGAVGGVVGGVIMTPLLSRFSKVTLARCSNMSAAPLFLLIAFAPGPIAVAAAMFIFYLTAVVWNTVTTSYRQRVVPDEIRGRVNSVYRLFTWGMMPLGLIISGIVVRTAELIVDRSVALTVPFLIAGAGIFVLATFSWRPLGRGFHA